MRALMIAALLTLPTTAWAQQPAPLSTVPAEYNLKVKPADVDNIGKGLGKLPFEEVAALMQSLRQQIVEQQQAQVPKPVEPAK